jgi:alpha-N-arabinofuranosidase
MQPTTLTLHSGFQIDTVDPRIFGGFLEHMGRAVYQGVYEPTSAHADDEGLRTDVLGALKRLAMPVVRYPGGNFVSGYHWENGVGPRESRPRVRELAWGTIEPNAFGTDEFMSLARKMGWAPMLTVNLGTGTPEEASNWVEYCNSETGSHYADMRAANASREPYGVNLWCLGNEMDGPWQLGHVPAQEYAMRAQQAAKLMKAVDPSIDLVVCGSCTPLLPSYMDWDRTVLEYIGGLADYVSLHRYVGNPEDDTPDFLAITNSIDQQIEEVDAVCRFVQAKRKSKKRIRLCFDEWNVWYKTFGQQRPTGAKDEFPQPLIEEVYNLEDALVVAGFLNSFIRHADCVKIANLAQIVNVIAPIQTRGDEMLIESIFYPFEMYSKRRSGVALRPSVQGPTYEGRQNGRVHFVDTSAILDGDRLQVFAINRSTDEEAPFGIELADRAIARVESAELLTGPGPKIANTFYEPDRIRPEELKAVEVRAGRAHAPLPPLSVVAMTLELEP